MVNVDTVYQTVQALANKEQRGYLTPQEFNLFANQAQKDIFDQYLYDINAFRQQRPHEYELGNSVSHIMAKLQPWTIMTEVQPGGNLPGNGAHLGRIFYRPGSTWNNQKEIVQIDEKGLSELRSMNASRWHRLKGQEDVAYLLKQNERRIRIFHFFPTTGLMEETDYESNVRIEIVTGFPSLVFWGYVVINEEATYDPSSTSHFDLHHSEQSELIIKILKLAGISIEDPGLYQSATGEDQIITQQENK